jgi:hypothetical protein
MAGRGHWAHDVGHWTIGGLAPADRREHERNVLTGYLEALPADGITATNDDPARDGYRGNAVPGLFRAANADGRYPEEVNIKVVERFAAAVSDLDASQSLRRSS